MEGPPCFRPWVRALWKPGDGHRAALAKPQSFLSKIELGQRRINLTDCRQTADVFIAASRESASKAIDPLNKVKKWSQPAFARLNRSSRAMPR